MSKEQNTEGQKSEVLQGTLHLMNQGTVYTSFLRLQQREWIASDCGTSENNHKAKFYSITKSGRKQLAHETENWEGIAGVSGRLLKLEGRE
jgi:PadR family transcriptional regulator, regulatory protein PadR